MGLNTVLESLGVYTPEGRLSTKELVEGCKVKPVFDLEELTGIKNRPVVADNEYALDLAREAATRCFEISKYSPEDIDLVICANICRHNGPNFKHGFEPSTAALLARDFDFSNAIIFDEPNACAGMFTAVHIVDAYLKAGFIKRGMVISGEALTCLSRTAQKEISEPLDPELQRRSLPLRPAGRSIRHDGGGGAYQDALFPHYPDGLLPVIGIKPAARRALRQGKAAGYGQI